MSWMTVADTQHLKMASCRRDVLAAMINVPTNLNGQRLVVVESSQAAAVITAEWKTAGALRSNDSRERSRGGVDEQVPGVGC